MKVLIGILIIAVLWVSAIMFIRKVWFYRDPVRTPEAKKGAIVSPCDGQVIYIKPVKNGKIISKKLDQEISVEEITKDKINIDEGYLVGIYMSPLDVHFNYAPIDGVIESMNHTQTKINLPMVDLWEYIQLTFLRRAVNLFGNKYHLENERNTIFIKGDIQIAMVEIADKFVNKIKLFTKIGDKVAIGQKLSFIERGSQVDLFFPKDSKIKVNLGQQVYGSQTIIATYEANPISKNQNEKVKATMSRPRIKNNIDKAKIAQLE